MTPWDWEMLKQESRVRIEGEYQDAFVDFAMEFAADKRRSGWFRDIDDFGNYYRKDWPEWKSFLFCAAWEIEEMTNPSAA